MCGRLDEAGGLCCEYAVSLLRVCRLLQWSVGRRFTRKFYVLRISATVTAIFYQKQCPPVCREPVCRALLLCGVFLSSRCRVCPPEKRFNPTRSAFGRSLLWRIGYEIMYLYLSDRVGCCGGPGGGCERCRALEFTAQTRQSESPADLSHCPRLGQQHAPGNCTRG